jgi:hypothetical protein
MVEISLFLLSFNPPLPYLGHLEKVFISNEFEPWRTLNKTWGHAW